MASVPADMPLTDFREAETEAETGAAPMAIDAVGQSVRLLSTDDAADPNFRAQWQELADGPSEPNPFFEPWFLLPSLEHFGQAGKTQIFALFEGAVLTGLMPLTARNNYYQYPIPNQAAWMHDNMFCGAPLVAKGHEADFWRALTGHLDREPRTALFFHLPALPADGILAASLAQVLALEGRTAAIVHSHERALLASDLTSEDYFNASLSTKKRKELRRQHRRLDELGDLTFERTSGAEGIAEWTAEFLALEQAGWKGEQGSALAESTATRSLFEQSLAGAAVAGRLERLTFRLNGKPIAMLANFITAPGSFSFKTAFDEDYARFSPGVLLQKENLALLDRGTIEWCDSCAASGHPMIEKIWREKRRMISVSLAVGGTIRRFAFEQFLRAETHTRLTPTNTNQSQP